MALAIPNPEPVRRTPRGGQSSSPRGALLMDSEMDTATGTLATEGGEHTAQWVEREKEYERLLEEKSELIRQLHAKVRDLEQHAPARPVLPEEAELLAMNEQLERDRHQVQQERRQLDEELEQFKEDRDSMTRQMREMEVEMAKERAELARQRSDVQRMMDELGRELERYERDQGLNDRLGLLRQRYTELAPRPANNTPAPEPEPQVHSKKGHPKEAGLLRRLFGQNR